MKYSFPLKTNLNRAIGVALIAAISSFWFSSAAYTMEKGPSTATAHPFDWKQSVMELRRRKLLIPIDGYDPEQMKGAFYQGRVGHIHHAADMPAPRNTPIRAVEDGTIGRLFESVPGGLTIYQKDTVGRFVYYYAHLEKYAEGLKDGDVVKRGQVIGYVGTSGNAPVNTPHLHFAISVTEPGGSVFKGQPIDPYEVYSKDDSVVGHGMPRSEGANSTHQKTSDVLRKQNRLSTPKDKSVH